MADADTAELYVIPNWDRDFENARSREVAQPRYFCVQNHFDGRKIKRLGKLGKKSAELYGIFHAIAAVASRCYWRGILFDEDGPLTALDLEDKTIFDEKTFEFALAMLSEKKIGLLKRFTIRRIDGKWQLPAEAAVCAVEATGRALPGAVWLAPATGTPAEAADPPAKDPPAVPATDPPAVTTGQTAGATAPQSPNGSSYPVLEGKDRIGKEGREAPPRRKAFDPDEIPSIAEQRLALSAIGAKAFKRPPRAADWNNPDKVKWLDEAQPVSRGDLAALDWLYGLPEDHRAREATKHRQTFETILQYLPGEIDKARTLQKEFAPFSVKKEARKQPDGWRAAYVELWGERDDTPNDFYKLTGEEQGDVLKHLEGKTK